MMSGAFETKALRGKVAVIVGGSGGIGRATCQILAEAGASVVVGYREGRARAEAIAAALPGDGHIALPVAIEESSSIAAFRDAVLAAFASVDILVNAAGVTTPVAHDDLDSLTDELIDRVFINNWRGVFATIRAFAHPLKANGDGLIVNVSSIAATTGIGSNIAYCGAKAGIDIMTTSLGRALAPHIRVLAISPGVVDTEFVPGRSQDFKDRTAQATPLKRLTTPLDVAEAILACATLIRFSTGTKILVDGGRHL